MKILGISCYFHDSAACLYADGEITAAAEEERFSRVKHDQRFPRKAIEFCLRSTSTAPADLDYVVFHEKPLLKLDRILKSCVDSFPHSLPLFVRAMHD